MFVIAIYNNDELFIWNMGPEWMIFQIRFPHDIQGDKNYNGKWLATMNADLSGSPSIYFNTAVPSVTLV